MRLIGEYPSAWTSIGRGLRRVVLRRFQQQALAALEGDLQVAHAGGTCRWHMQAAQRHVAQQIDAALSQV
jgi:hypothetical protein